MKAWILQISAGVGPWEVRAFVAALAATLEDLVEARGLRVESVATTGDPEAPASVALVLGGDAQAELGDLLGTHALVARSPRRARAARKRWFASVSLHPLLVATLAAVDPADVDFRADRAGGPGGQHVNKTASAIRAYHRPSGITVRVVQERSQHENRRLALERLAALLTARDEESVARAQSSLRHAHYELLRGNPVCVWRPDPRGRDRLCRDRG